VRGLARYAGDRALERAAGLARRGR
jgi:hypothetical protein